MINWTTKTKVCVGKCSSVITFISGAKNTLILQIFELVKRKQNETTCKYVAHQNEIMSLIHLMRWSIGIVIQLASNEMCEIWEDDVYLQRCENVKGYQFFFILKCFLGQIIWKWEMCRCRILDHRLSFCTLALMDHDCHFGIKRLKECHSKHPKSVLESYGSQCSCLFRVYSGFITMFEL